MPDDMTTSQARTRAISDHASRFHGVVTTSELHGMSFGDDSIRRLMTKGFLWRRYRGVHTVGHRSLSRKGTWYAAVRAAGPGAVLSHVAAAQLWGIDASNSRRIDVTTPVARRRMDGFHSHSSKRLDGHVSLVDDIPVTSVVRTISDLASRYRPGRLARVIKEAEFRGLVTLPELIREARAKHGRPHVRTLRAAIDLRRGRSTGTASRLEDRVLAQLELYPIVQPSPGVPITTLFGEYLVDAVWEEFRICMEVDGDHGHARPAERALDAVRTANLRDAGWTVHRIAERDFDRDPHDAVIALVRDVQAAMGTSLPADSTNLVF